MTLAAIICSAYLPILADLASLRSIVPEQGHSLGLLPCPQIVHTYIYHTTIEFLTGLKGVCQHILMVMTDKIEDSVYVHD